MSRKLDIMLEMNDLRDEIKFTQSKWSEARYWRDSDEAQLLAELTELRKKWNALDEELDKIGGAR